MSMLLIKEVQVTGPCLLYRETRGMEFHLMFIYLFFYLSLTNMLRMHSLFQVFFFTLVDELELLRL